MSRLRLYVKTDLLPHGPNTQIHLGGIDISNNIIELELQMNLHEATTAVLTLKPDELEIDAEALLRLKAEVDAR